jgi:hypothetical protein
MNPTSLLKTFYNNESEREAVKAFFVQCLSRMAVERTFAGEDVSGIKEAHELTERVFDELAGLYSAVEKRTVINSR